ncbi:hypothetical protein VTK73DRAFT_5144 [Phialemonium thermophilum]|uniref:Secreted protein n=1 Tax=Phialemonium thermophilum TaxID=223376 RepID=A0ABR3V336_9PEZI
MCSCLRVLSLLVRFHTGSPPYSTLFLPSNNPQPPANKLCVSCFVSRRTTAKSAAFTKVDPPRWAVATVRMPGVARQLERASRKTRTGEPPVSRSASRPSITRSPARRCTGTGARASRRAPRTPGSCGAGGTPSP